MDKKDPAEIITVTFDFSDYATTCSNPVVTCLAVSGNLDPSASAMLSGSPQINGALILQRIIGGQDGTTYKLRCEVDDEDGEHWVQADTLEVQTF
jgi:hypothetical protein